MLCLRWVRTWKQLADPLTKKMATELLQKFRASQMLGLVATKEDNEEESRRSAICKAQRDQRKQRMAKTSNKTFLPQCDHYRGKSACGWNCMFLKTGINDRTR